MTRSRTSIWKSAAVVLAAYLLVAQAVLAGLTSGAVASPRDVFSQVICTTTDSAGPEAPSQSPHLASCCVIGCAMFGPSVAPPPDAFAFSGAGDLAPVAAAFPPRAAARPTLERTPKNSRAPPRNA